MNKERLTESELKGAGLGYGYGNGSGEGYGIGDGSGDGVGNGYGSRELYKYFNTLEIEIEYIFPTKVLNYYTGVIDLYA